MRFTTQEIARAVGGSGIGDAAVDGVSCDSRAVAPGMLFVAVVSARDGHRFVDDARAAGAVAWISSESDERVGAIVVDDTIAALQKLGSHARERLTGGVIAVTGSSGKTSTKDLVGSVLRQRGPAAASEKSFNNEMGVPLTLANAPDGAWAAVIEMGARGAGHIASLCAIARPTVGVVTNIGLAHRELFGTAEATTDAKGELIEALPRSGTAVLNADDAMFERLRARAECPVVTFSASGHPSADLRASAVRLDDALRPSFHMESPWGRADISLALRGAHQVDNALAAAASALAVGASLDECVEGFAKAEASPWRMEMTIHRSGARLVNDAYNANPGSMRVALAALVAVAATRRIAVLGTMAEIGAESTAAHQEIADQAFASGIDVVLAVDEPSYGRAATHVHGIEGALHALAALGAPAAGDAILVKASRVAGLERVVHALAGGGS